MRVTKTRSLIKAVSFRVLATSFTLLIVYLITGRIKIAATIGGIDFIGKLVLYYLHERVWDKIDMGRINE